MRSGRAAAACSWSGGKDSALALAHAADAGVDCRALVTMLDESGERSRSHGLPLVLLEAQAEALGLPLVTRATTWDGYTDAFADALGEIAGRGMSACVFGDIDIEAHRRWCAEVCASVGVEALHPLWGRGRRELLDDLIARGFTATVVVVRTALVDASFLGRRLDRELVAELEACGVDACGENGEYHTVVTGGPSFARPVEVRARGRVAVGGCLALEVEPARAGV